MPPVTAERSPPASRITGADSPVIADSSTEATPSMTSPSPGMNSPATTDTMSPERSFELAIFSICAVGQDAVGNGFRPCLAQRIGLGLAAAFGHGLGEVGEQHREPQPERDLQVEAELTLVTQHIAHQQDAW